MRTGDTPQKERRELQKEPPDILITTPESLYLMLTSQARETLRGIETLILDEVHAVAGTKRGAHLAISVERLESLVEQPMQRIGLSATQRPIEEIGRFVSGGRPIQIVDAGTRKELDLEVVVPVEDMRELGSTASLSYPAPVDGQEMDSGTEHGAQSIWPSIYPEVLRLVEEHRSTIVFVNNRRLAERLALRLNELAVERWGAGGPAVLHLCGQRDYEALRDRVSRPDYRLLPFTDDIGAAYGAADLALARAGGSVWELAAAGLPAVLVPYPHATADHQTKNARHLEAAGAAVVVPEAELERAPSLVEELLADGPRRERMRRAMLEIARPDAAAKIAEELMALASA